MTNAEAIKVLERMRQWTDYPKEALTMAIEALSRQEPPSNPDEMAGQFQKIEGELVDWYETNGVDYCHGISTNEAFEVPEGFYIKKR